MESKDEPLIEERKSPCPEFQVNFSMKQNVSYLTEKDKGGQFRYFKIQL